MSGEERFPGFQGKQHGGQENLVFPERFNDEEPILNIQDQNQFLDTTLDTTIKYVPRKFPSNLAFSKNSEVEMRHQIGPVVTLISIVTENLVCHPFLVLRRQCQVNHNSTRYHLTPFTLIPTMYKLQSHQGISPLWKGVGSALIVRGMTLGVEDLLARTTTWPKEIKYETNLSKFFDHIMLKCVSLAIVTPFYAASLVETVQSDIASDTPGFLDVFKEGISRLFQWSHPTTKLRLIPFFKLLLPTVGLGLVKYMFHISMHSITKHVMMLWLGDKVLRGNDQPSPYDDLPTSEFILEEELDQDSHVFATMVTDIVFYPFETVLHRVHLQGTRTIIDNLDTGRTVLAILTDYAGPLHCWNKCLLEEGTTGFYKGIGAVFLHFIAHIAIIKLSRSFLTTVGLWYQQSKKEVKLETQAEVDDASPIISNLTSSTRSYLLP